MSSLPLCAFDAAAEQLRAHGCFFFMKSGACYLDPGVPEHWKRLLGEGVQEDAESWRAVEELLLARLPDLEPRIYFPVPMARNRDLEDEVLLERFSYRMIVVDDDQRWFWNGTEVAERTRLFFTEHLAYERAVDRYYFEYAVNPDWVDKSYLEARMTPMLAKALRRDGSAVECLLNNGSKDRLEPGSFRFDSRERLFARSERHGEVLVDGNERFRLLSKISEDLLSTELDGLTIALTYDTDP